MVGIQITPEELYFLSKLCGGKHLNYVYISAMDDIQQNAALYTLTCKESLRKQGILKESFTGGLTLAPTVTRLLEPVFFGDFESSLDICWKGTPSRVKVIRFHWFKDRCTIISSEGKTLKVQEFDTLRLSKTILSLMPDGYQKRRKPNAVVFSGDGLTRIIALKQTAIGQPPILRAYYELDGWLCSQEEREMTIISPKRFYDEAMSILKGA